MGVEVAAGEAVVAVVVVAVGEERGTAMNPPPLGLGIGWRPELALMIDRRADIGFVEIVAEPAMRSNKVPQAILVLRERGVTVIPHGLTLSLGSAELPDRERLKALSRLARQLNAPLISEHLAFVRAGGIESGHLLPLPRTREALNTVVKNIRAAQSMLPVPLALENIASLFEWPTTGMSEVDFLAEVLDQTGAWLLLDIENLYAHHLNHGIDPLNFMDRLPLQQLAYVHVAGGFKGRDGLYHDTHAHDVPGAVFDLLRELCARHRVPGVMIERDDAFPPDGVLHAELDAVSLAMGSVGSPLSRLKNDVAG